MLPVLPFLVGGTLGTVASIVFKNMYSEIEQNNYTKFKTINESLEILDKMKTRVYHDSFIKFLDFYDNLKNADLGKLYFIELNPFNIEYKEFFTNEFIENNIKVTVDLLFKANNILENILVNLNQNIDINFDYNSLDIKQQFKVKDAYLLASYIQKVCLSRDLSEDMIVKFNNIISDLEDKIKSKL